MRLKPHAVKTAVYIYIHLVCAIIERYMVFVAIAAVIHRNLHATQMQAVTSHTAAATWLTGM